MSGTSGSLISAQGLRPGAALLSGIWLLTLALGLTLLLLLPLRGE